MMAYRSLPDSCRDRGVRSCALAMLVLLVPAMAPAFESNHQSVDLVWSSDGAECAAAPMTLTGDGFWSTAVPATGSDATALVYFQYMVDGNLQPNSYGKDIERDFGLLFGPNPPSVVVSIAVPGYTVFTLDETALLYSVAAAPGLIRATVTYENASPPPADLLAATRAEVRDQTAALDLGSWGGADAQSVLAIGGLLPAHTYQLTFSAPGYRAVSVTEALPDAGARDIMVTLWKIVPTEPNSWGSIKTLYR